MICLINNFILHLKKHLKRQPGKNKPWQKKGYGFWQAKSCDFNLNPANNSKKHEVAIIIESEKCSLTLENVVILTPLRTCWGIAFNALHMSLCLAKWGGHQWDVNGHCVMLNSFTVLQCVGILSWCTGKFSWQLIYLYFVLLGFKNNNMFSP